MSAGYLSLDQIHYGQSNPAGHLACTLRGPQAFTAKWGDASSFNAQSHRNQWGISLTHYLTLMPCGIKREVQNAVEQIFLSSKHKWSEVVFNLLLCWADNAWPQARTLAYNHTICSSLCVCMRRLRKCIHQQFSVLRWKTRLPLPSFNSDPGVTSDTWWARMFQWVQKDVSPSNVLYIWKDTRCVLCSQARTECIR